MWDKICVKCYTFLIPDKQMQDLVGKIMELIDQIPRFAKGDQQMLSHMMQKCKQTAKENVKSFYQTLSISRMSCSLSNNSVSR